MARGPTSSCAPRSGAWKRRRLLALVVVGLSVVCGHGHVGHTHHGDLSPEERHRHLLAAEAVARVVLTRLPAPKPSAPGQHVGARRLLGDAGVSEEEAELEAPFGRRLALAFNAFGQDHHAEMTLNDALFEPSAVTHTYDDQGRPIVRRPVAMAYTGRFLDGGWIRATVHDAETVQALWLDKKHGRLSMLVPVDMYEHRASDVAAYARARGGRMLAFHLEDMASISHDSHDRALIEQWLGPHVLGHAARPLPKAMVRNETMTDGFGGGRGLQSFADSVLENAVVNTLAPYGLMLGCPSTIYRVPIGVAVDVGYTKALTGLGRNASVTVAMAARRVEKDLQQQVNIVNLLYSDMANVFLTIGKTVIKTAPGNEKWNQEPLDAAQLTGKNRKTYGCPVSRAVRDDSDYQSTLNHIGDWRQALPAAERFAMWHLLTNCYPPAGTVGLAFIGATCSTSNMGASWANLQNEATWLTIAHELGHNFGAYHTMDKGGVMSYDAVTQKEFKFTGGNPAEVCNHVNRQMGVCYTVQTAKCGNGVLEPGEECDDSSGCCNRRTCKLRAGAMCTPGLDEQCCTASCTYHPSFVGCNVPGGSETGYCFNGFCRYSRLAAAYSNLEGCPAPTSNACKEYVRFNNGACTNTDASFKLTGYNMPDGAFCDAALTKRCNAGQCATATPTAAPTDRPSTTRKPTRAPSRSPTRAPSRSPTRTPTRSPTRAPSRSPTRAPTRRRTRMPTRAPSSVVQRSLQMAGDGVHVDSGRVEDATPAPTPGEASVLLTNPLLGETLYNGAIALVRWTTNAALATVDLTLSDGTEIVAGLDAAAANGSYYWSVRAAPAMAHAIHIRAQPVGGGEPLEDVSEQFAVQDQTAATVTAPARDEVMVLAQALSIKWATTGGTLTDINLAVVAAHNRSKVLVDLGDQPNSGEYVWVPSTSLRQGRVAVQLTYSPASAASVTVYGPPFRLRKPAQEGVVSFLAPVTGEKLELGAKYTVMWTSPPSLSTATLYLLQPTTGLNVTLFSGKDTGAFVWTVGSSGGGADAAAKRIPAGAGYQLALVDASPTGEYVLNCTSSPFVIYEAQPGVTIHSIFEGQDGAMWVRGRNATIRFTATNPADTITFEIQDGAGAVVHTVTSSAPAADGVFVYPVPYQVPPPDCFSCFLVAVSNLYPGVYHTFSTPFSIGSHEHSDIRSQRVAPSLVVTFPETGAVLERGRQYTFTWDGVLVANVALLLTNRSTETTALLAIVPNTGSFKWAVPLDPGAVGEYDLSLLAVDTGAAAVVTPDSHDGSAHFIVVDPPPAQAASLRFAAEPPLPTTWSEGDTLAMAYTSEGLQDLLTVRVLSLELGLLFTVTDAAPTSGSVSIDLPAPPREPLLDAYVELSVASGAAAPVRSPLATYYKARSLADVRVPPVTLYKGQTYTVTWKATGLPFPVLVLLYAGSDRRQTMNGQPCVPWKDTGGAEYTDCVLSYDLENEVCATAVDQDDLWAEGGQCAPVASTFKYVLQAAGGEVLSTQGFANITLAAASADLPAPGDEYSIVVAAATAGMHESARSEMFAIEESDVVLTFGIILGESSATLESLRGLLLLFLASTLAIDPSRLSLQLTQTTPDDPTRFTTETTIARAEIPTSMSAFEAAAQFLGLWQAAGLNPGVLELDKHVAPRLRYTNLAPGFDAGRVLPAEVEQLITQEGLDVSGPRGTTAPAFPIDVSGPQPGRLEDAKARVATLMEKENGNRILSAAKGVVPLATLIGVGTAFVLMGTLAIMGVYALRRRGGPRARTRSVLRVQSTAPQA